MVINNNNIEIIYHSLTSDLHRQQQHQERRPRFVAAYDTTTTDQNDVNNDDDDRFDADTYRNHDANDVSNRYNNNMKSHEVMDEQQSQTTQTYVTYSSSEHSQSQKPTQQEQQSSVTTTTTVDWEKEVFQKARHYLNPGCFFRFVTYWFAERKLFTFFWIHCIATLVVWGTCLLLCCIAV